jgi:hypothetical protein
MPIGYESRDEQLIEARDRERLFVTSEFGRAASRCDDVQQVSKIWLTMIDNMQSLITSHTLGAGALFCLRHN